MAPFHSSSLQYSSSTVASGYNTSTLTSGSASATNKNTSRMTMSLAVFDHHGLGFTRTKKQCSCCNKRNLGIYNISNGSRLYCCMQVVNPLTNKRFETLSYVPPLSAEQIVKQVDYIVSKGWIPCLEFDQNASISRENSKECNYYDGRYWTLWKLPMFGCVDASAVLREIEECKKVYPHAYIRLMAFDNERQTQVVAIVVHKPSL